MPTMRVPKLLILTLFSLFFLSPAFAQTTSKISGEVVDATTGDPLPGANVLLMGTSIGGSTDINGRYEIRNVSAGSYSIRVTYIGYDQLITKTQVKAGLDMTVNFKLQPVALQGKEVVVTAQASGQNAAINQQLSSMQVTNVVSAARIQELPDANAAESIARLPGVSVLRSGGEADQVVVRGLAPKYNEVTINGVQMAGSDPNDRSVDLSMISSTSLNGEEVTKTVTPDMDANVLGGVVNFDMREANVEVPGVPRFGVTVQGAYNGLSDVTNKLNNYQAVVSGEDRFLDNRFGVFAQASFENKNLSDNEYGATFGQYLTSSGNPYTDDSQYVTNNLTLDDIYRIRQRGNAVLTLDYKLPDGKILFSNFGSSGNTKTDDRQQYYTGPSVEQFNAIRTNSTLNTMTNLLSYEQQAGILHFKATVTHAYSETRDPNDWTIVFQNGSDGTPPALWTGPNVDPRSIPAAANNATGAGTLIQTLQSQYIFTRERDLGGALDFDTHLNFSDEVTSVIKFGGKYQYQTRTYNTDYLNGEAWTYVSGAGVVAAMDKAFPQLPKSGGDFEIDGFLDHGFNYGTFLGGDYQLHNPLNFTLLQDFVDSANTYTRAHPNGNDINYDYNIGQSLNADYKGQEEISAAYVMATVDIGPTLTIIPGVRWQQLKTDYIALQGYQSPDPFNNYPSYLDTVIAYHPYWLPDILVRFKPADWFDVRLGYTNTVSYPDYSALAPIIVVTQGSNVQWNGENLVPARSTNYDAMFSAYNNSIGLFTVDGFLKQITNLIYQYTFTPPTTAALAKYYPVKGPPPTSHGLSVTEYINSPYKVNDVGMELDWQTHFWYLPGPLTGLVLDINYTHIFSKARYPSPFITSRLTHAYVDSFYYAPLLYQPDDIANLTLGYDYRGFSLRVSYIYSSKVFAQPQLEPVLLAYTTAYSRWDIALKQVLPLPGLEIYCNLNNINSANDKSVISAPNSVPQSEQSYGYTAEVGFRYQL